MSSMLLKELAGNAILCHRDVLFSILVESWEVRYLDAAFVDMLTLNLQKFPGAKSGFQSYQQTDNESHEGF